MIEAGVIREFDRGTDGFPSQRSRGTQNSNIPMTCHPSLLYFSWMTCVRLWKASKWPEKKYERLKLEPRSTSLCSELKNLNTSANGARNSMAKMITQSCVYWS